MSTKQYWPRVKRIFVKFHHICTYFVSHYHATTNNRSETLVHIASWCTDTSRTSEEKHRAEHWK